MTQVSASLTIKETETTITKGSVAWANNFRDRLNWSRIDVLTKVINAWRSNPIAKRIIEITTEFVLGDGFGWTAANKSVDTFIKRFFLDEVNDLHSQLKEWADEAWRSGDLFILFSVDEGGMPHVRALPAEQIEEITTEPNDYRQEIAYKRQGLDENPYPAWKEGSGSKQFVLHFALNRAVGAQFGESDLASVLYWIGLYKQWLEDRAKLNYYRQLFSFVVTKKFDSEAAKKSYGKELAARTPQPGSILLTDPEETWEVIAPKLESQDANDDGLAIKRMIAIGVGLPLHYLGEPESSTRTTAEAAGTPVFERFKSRQVYLRNVVHKVVEVAIAVYRENGGRLPSKPDFDITCPDITERDNANLAIGVQRIVSAFSPLLNSKLIDNKEFIRLVYRFLSEVAPDNIPEKYSPINLRTGGKDMAGARSDPLPAEVDPKPVDPAASK
jgi:hypothetical protein